MKQKEKNILTSEQEAMRLQVVDLELKARYWKSQFEIRNYTLASEELQPKYDEFLTTSRDNLTKAIEAAQKNPDTVPELNIEAKEVVDNG